MAIRHDYWITEGIDPSLKYNIPYFLRILLLALFIFLNIFVVMLSAQFAPHWYNKLKQMAVFSDQLMPIYWATVIVLVLFNTLFLIASLAVYSAHPRTGTCILHPETSLCKDIRSTDMYTDLMAAVIAKILLLPLALMVEFIIAVRIIKDTSVPINRKVMLVFLLLFFTQYSIQNHPYFCPVALDDRSPAGCRECYSP